MMGNLLMPAFNLQILAMSDHVLLGAANFLANPAYVLITAAAWAMAIIAYFVLRSSEFSPRQKTVAIYAHLLFLALPVVMFGQSLSCPYGNPGCAVQVTQVTTLTLPIAMLIAGIAATLLIPRLNLYKSRKMTRGKLASFARAEGTKAGIPAVEIHAFASSKPLAFSQASSTNRIFISVGMMETLTRKELEAVALHEIEHLRRSTPLFKASTAIYRLFSPISAVRAFNSSLVAEERIADEYAAKRQGTDRYLKSAKKKAG